MSGEHRVYTDHDDVCPCVRSPPRPTCPPSSLSTLKVSRDESRERRKISVVSLDIMGYYALRPGLGETFN